MLKNGMRDIGKDTTLYRASHDDILKQLGIKNYTNMTEQQLQSQLVGVEFKTTSYMSTSYDRTKNPFMPGNVQGGGREVEQTIKAGKNTKVFLGAKSQTEVVTDVGTDLRITGVKFKRDSRGNIMYANPRLGGSKPILEMEFETI